MAAAIREKFSSQAAPEVLAALRRIAESEGRQFQAVLDEALWEYIERRKNLPSGKTIQPIIRHHMFGITKTFQVMTWGCSIHDFDVECLEHRIIGGQRHPLDLRLGSEHPVKRVPMIMVPLPRQLSMSRSDG